MAKNTSKSYRNQVIYSVFVRNYSRQGTFEAVEKDLHRIKDLGVDIIWLLPVHPIGEVNRKGVLGSPYAIKDYRKINPEFGTFEDFTRLVNAIHDHGMKCIIDVVYNHTSPDSWLVENHPEWFFHTSDGSFGNKVGEWLDVVDLDYSNMALWDYQIETLKQWAEIVDGFRCDVAPLIPLDFWLRARQEVASVCPDCFWLSESVEPLFTIDNRDRGFISLSDSEILQAFDACYEYDIFAYFRGYLEGRYTLSEYVEKINQQEAIYPENYVKLRFLENHDNVRAKFIIPNQLALINWTAFIYFQKGMTLLYAGQEKMDRNLPSLFDEDPVRWNTGQDISALLSRLYAIKKDPIFTDSRYKVRALPHEVLYATHRHENRQLTGIFSVRGNSSLISTKIPDGVYINLIDDGEVRIKSGKISCDGNPLIFESVREDV
ncbi:alpha-amylase [bacterium]|nr:alpha-amylase [bacterium]